MHFFISYQKLFKFILLGITVLFLYIGVLFSFQNSIIFYPDTKYIPPKIFMEHQLVVSDGNTLTIWYYKGTPNQPTILFFHGNAGQNATFAPQLLPLIQKGYSVAIMEYRGFGKTKGSISQKNVYQDALETFDWLKQNGAHSIISYGYSFGTTVATQLAAKRPVDKLILMAPFASLKQLAKEKPIPFASFILKDYYLSENFIKEVKVPTLFIHSKKDALIPYQHSKILYQNSPSQEKTLKLIENDTHNSTYFSGSNMPFILNWLENFEK